MIKAQGTQGDKGTPGKDGDQGDDGLSAYELYVKYNPYYKRAEDMWVEDLINGKLAIASKENTIDAIEGLDEGFGFITKGQIVYKAKDFAILSDDTWKLLLKVDENFKYDVGDYLSIKGSIISENNMNIIGKEVEYEKTGHKDLNSSYYDNFDKTSLSNYFISNKNNLKYIEYVGQLQFNNNYYVTEKKATSSIVNSEMFDGLENLKDKEVIIKGYLLGSNENILFYATSIEQKKINIEKVVVRSEETIYLGYNLSKIAKVYPEDSPQEVIWEIANASVASLSSEGIVKGIKKGEFKIRAVSKYDSSKASEWVNVKVIDESEVVAVPDYKGYEIKVMAERCFDYDPFYSVENDSRVYNDHDKVYKQEAWHNIEKKYNVKISVVSDPLSDIMIEKDMNKLAKEYAKSGNSPIDIMVLKSSDIPLLVKDNVIYDLSNLTDKYTYDEMNKAYKESVYYKGRVYGQQIYAHLDSRTSITGLLYDYDWVAKLNVEDPAKMFNEGNWTYSSFSKWVKEVKSKLNESEFVLQASPSTYFNGMSKAAGIKLANEKDYTINLMEYEQIQSIEMMEELLLNDCVSSLDYMNFYNNSSVNFVSGKVVMTTEKLYNAYIYSNKDKLGFVPFPYPDYMNKNDTKVSLNQQYTYMYIKGKKYPQIDSSITMTYENVWEIMNELFITSKKNMDNDEEFSYEDVIENEIIKYIDNSASIEAIMFYNESRIMYDPFEFIFNEVALNGFTKKVIIEGCEYLTEANIKTEEFQTELKKHYNP